MALYYRKKEKNKKEDDKKRAGESKSGVMEKNSKAKYRREHSEELLQVISRVASDKNLLEDFLRDLLSPAEYKEAALRWQIVKHLHKGATQHEVAENLKVAIGTVTRGARALLNDDGGFNKVL